MRASSFCGKHSIDAWRCTAVTEGSGTITVAHGVMPVPVPAAAKTEQAFHISQDSLTSTYRDELSDNQTGLTLCHSPCIQINLQNLTATKVGYGFGKRDTGKFNALRGTLLQSSLFIKS